MSPKEKAEELIHVFGGVILAKRCAFELVEAFSPMGDSHHIQYNSYGMDGAEYWQAVFDLITY